MADAAPAKPQPGRKADDDKDDDLEQEEHGLLGPPEEDFWERYNHHLEFPLSTIAAILFHVLVAGVIVFMLYKLMNEDGDRSGVPVKLIDVTGGQDDAGLGSAGSGGKEDPLNEGSPQDKFKAEKDKLPTPDELPEIKETLRKIIDDGGQMPIAAANAQAYSTLDDKLKKKMLGSDKGSGPGSGKGFDGSAGSGPGGTGADSTRARSLRWVMRFKTSNGDDYLSQLAAMGAVILVPLPPENEKCLYFTDLRNPGSRKMATDDDLKRLAGQIKFSDTRPDSVRGVCAALGVRENPRSFWAFFPRGIEDELSRKETGYRNRRAEDIEETVFRVVIRGGGYEVIVDEQSAKR